MISATSAIDGGDVSLDRGIDRSGRLAYLKQVHDEGRLSLVGRSHQVAAGVELIEVGGHPWDR